MPLVEVEAVRRSFGPVDALAGVSLTVEEGEWVAVTGPSGSGKSTLLNLLAGLDRPTAGGLRVAGTDLATASAEELARHRRETVGVVFQEFHLIPHLDAIENVMLAQYLHSMADRKEAEAALVRVGLGDRLRHLPGELSGGERQRVCVARALINHPRLLLADEPTGNLDAANERRVLELLEDLHGEGFTLMVVTHDPVVAGRAGRTIRLEHGRPTAAHPPLDGHAELLASLWRWRQRGGGALDPIRLERAVAAGYLRRVEGGVEVTSAGEAAIDGLLRRLRLAEALLAYTLQGSELPPCGGARPLGPERVEEVCRFLGHPERCPHGEPIPSAACCPSRIGAPVVSSSEARALRRDRDRDRDRPGG